MGARVDYGDVKRLREAGLRNNEIAVRLKCCESTVERAAMKMGLPKKTTSPAKRIDVPLLHKLWASEMAFPDIAVALGVSSTTLYTLRKTHGLPRRPHGNVTRLPDVDPTPAELEERKRQCRERHYAQRRGETEQTTLQWRNGGAA